MIPVIYGSVCSGIEVAYKAMGNSIAVPFMRFRMFCDVARRYGIWRPYHLRFADAAELEQEKEKTSPPAKARLDNLIESLLDALFEDDSHIWDAQELKLGSKSE